MKMGADMPSFENKNFSNVKHIVFFTSKETATKMALQREEA